MHRNGGRLLEKSERAWRTIYELIGLLAIDPGPYSFRQLHWMLEAKRKEEWDHTASLLWQTAELNRDEKKRKTPFAVEDFHPYKNRPTPKRPPVKMGIGVLKSVFVDRSVPTGIFT